MKLWNARSVTYKTHLFSALCRSLFTNCCWIFGTSLLVKLVGSKGYSQLYFFASLSSLLYYIYYAFRGQKGKEAYRVYRFVLILSLIASVGCFLEPLAPFHAALAPYNALLLYVFVIAVMTVDLVGTTLGPIVLQSSVNPAIFRRVYQSIVTTEVISRIAAALIVWLLSQGHLLAWLYPIAWALLMAHFILFGLTVWRMRVSELKFRTAKPPTAFENLSDSIRFMLSNTLVRIAMTLMVWSTVTKFVLEFLFYQVGDDTFSSARQVASFVSATTMTMYVLSLIVHHFLGRKLTSRLQLSELLSIQPINILILGGLALVLPPFWPVVLLMVTYNIVHRSIQLPMSRQCLVPVPRAQRSTILSIISIVVAVATMVTSGVMTILKNSLHQQDFLVLLLLLGAAIFFVTTSLDSYYIRNLWSFFAEGKSGNWQDEPQAERISQAELESAATEEEEYFVAGDLKADPLLATYAFSTDRQELAQAVSAHKQLLSSALLPDVSRGLNVCFTAGFPWFLHAVEAGSRHESDKIRGQAERILAIETAFADNLEDYSSAFRRKIKAVAMDLVAAGRQEDYKSLSAWTASNANHEITEALVDALADPKFTHERALLFECIAQGGVSLQPILERMQASSYNDAQTIRELLEQLNFGKSTSELLKRIDENLTSLRSTDLPFKQEAENPSDAALQLFMHTLFLEEYRLSERHSNDLLLQSIGEFQTISVDESGILIDMHLSFLKRSEFFSRWQALVL